MKGSFDDLNNLTDYNKIKIELYTSMVQFLRNKQNDRNISCTKAHNENTDDADNTMEFMCLRNIYILKLDTHVK